MLSDHPISMIQKIASLRFRKREIEDVPTKSKNNLYVPSQAVARSMDLTDL